MATATTHLTERMKDQAVLYIRRTNAGHDDAMKMARLGLLTLDGRPKFAGGPAPKPGEKRRAVLEVTNEEHTTFRRKAREASRVGLGKDELGYYVTDGKRRSSSYPTIALVPVAVVRDYAG